MTNMFKTLRPLFCVLTILLTLSFLLDLSYTSSHSNAKFKDKKVLVVSVTKGFRHKSIPTLEKTLQEISDQSKAFTVDYARTDEELIAKMSPQALETYDGVVFASATGKALSKKTGNPKEDDLPIPDIDAFLNWIKAGHAFVGIHAATDTFHGHDAYIEMIGGEFEGHGPQKAVSCIVEDMTHPAMQGLGKIFSVHDEIYRFKNFNRDNVRTLVSMDKHPDTGAAGYYPLVWCRMYGKGRMFYTAFGHREDVITSLWFKRHVLGGMQWSLGQVKGNARPQVSEAQRNSSKLNSPM